VTDTRFVVPDGGTVGDSGGYCSVKGKISPVDKRAPNIEFEVALPTLWNSKALMFGGGGYDGRIPSYVTGPYYNTIGPSALQRGYAVFASDSGHQVPIPTSGYFVPDEGKFALNEEAYRNFIGDALKKTRDVAVAIIEARYGKKPSKSYFLGGSAGGREALMAASRWPGDWDGVVSQYPIRNLTAASMATLRYIQAMSRPGAFLNSAKRAKLFAAGLEACDMLDGANDRLVSNIRACKSFDPFVATVGGVPLRCPDGRDTGDACLSDQQIETAKLFGSPYRLNFKVGDGLNVFPGYNVFTSDTDAAFGATQPLYPSVSSNSAAAQFISEYIRFFVTRDPSQNYLTFNVDDPGRYKARLEELSRADAMDSNMSGFAAKGGKLLILHGTADLMVSARATELYLGRLETVLGKSKVASFVRYYEVAGLGHAVGAFNAQWDQISALENWVEKGVDPANNLTVMDSAGVPGRTRPLCEYPSWPRYKGQGDINAASSFECDRGDRN
jgi:feruloyl esterase